MEPVDLKSRIEIALGRGHLSQWQRQFLIDIHARLVKYGPKARLTDKQRAKLFEVIGYAPPSSQAPPQSRPNSSQSPRWRQRRRRSPIVREVRYLAGRFVTAFGMMLALVVASLIYSYVNNPNTTSPSSPALALPNAGSLKPLARSQFTITDGDTIRLNGAAKGTRLVGFNTPESIEPRCEAEAQLGRRAKARLKELVAAAGLELRMVACACTPGTEGTDRCNYGRSCGSLLVDGRDVGEVLVSEGLAVTFVCGSTSCPPTPRPWCG
ncbi:thermonuclease family protein [Mesorhizobium delmotii]|uniref:Membrane protein n=1 Tax=Mesorhizobium delmotii TaxID=1631247 RepID=A0A2P9AS82_9HYPH|nr:thermonuclease family protein [Mesorhizobium delmotii]SJM34035.1 Membrane protein [Mesorhizobium delmotii]